MEISRDAILRIVRAARMSLKLEKTINTLLIDTKNETIADRITEHLCDALSEFVGEHLSPEQDFFDDSKVMKTIADQIVSDNEATEIILMEYWDNHPESMKQTEQPCPHFIDRNEMQKQAEVGCGYMTPRGGRT